MKLINTTIGRNPPVVRMHSFIQRAICYQLIETPCESWVESKDEVKFAPTIPNEFPANSRTHTTKTVLTQEKFSKEIKGTPLWSPNWTSPDGVVWSGKRTIQCETPPNNARYRIYTDDEVLLEDFVPIENNKFKILVPPLDAGYYYLDVYARDGFNRVMLNVTE